MTIPRLIPIGIQPRPLNDRLWRLVDKEAAGTLSPMERIELDCLCKSLETEQDNGSNA